MKFRYNSNLSYATSLLERLRRARARLERFGAVPSLIREEGEIMKRMLDNGMIVPDRGFEIEETAESRCYLPFIYNGQFEKATEESLTERRRWAEEVRIEREIDEANRLATEQIEREEANGRVVEEWFERHPNPQLEDLLGEKFPLEVVQVLFGKSK